MVAAYTPERHSGMALGSLSAAVYSGSMVGTFLGGMLAGAFRLPAGLSGLGDPVTVGGTSYFFWGQGRF